MNFASNQALSAYRLDHPDLTRLVAVNCPDITDLGELPQSLRELVIQQCPGLKSLPELPSTLTSLWVENCAGITSLPELPGTLTHLFVENCPGITSVPALPSTLQDQSAESRSLPTTREGEAIMSESTQSRDLRFLDVIMSDRFVYATQHKPLHGSEPIWVGFRGPASDEDRSDPTRAQAKFLVLSVALAGETDALGGPGSVWTEVTAIRLNGEGCFDPGGEVISFPANGNARNVIREVMAVGKMTLSFQPSE